MVEQGSLVYYDSITNLEYPGGKMALDVGRLHPRGMRTARHTVCAPSWRDPKRHLWLLGTVVPALVAESWLLVLVTGFEAFWWWGPVFTFGVVPITDWIVGRDADNPPDSALSRLQEDKFYRWITYMFLPNQYISVALACWLWSGGGWVTMTFTDRLGLMLTVGIVGGIAISTAHELGHRRERVEKRLSMWALAQSFYGQFYVEHNCGHHARVATAEDPASSRLGESLYRFIPRSVSGGLRSAWHIECARLARTGKSPWSLHNQVLSAWLLSAVLFAVMVAWFGIVVLPLLIGQAIVAVCLLEAVNYLEHYGLRRQKLADGRYERVQPSHSWNSNTVIANVFLFHLQRHSDHHAHPQRRYQTLRHCDNAPQLPFGYATMLLIAAVPPWWRHVMDRRVLEHYNGDVTLAAVSPRHNGRRAGQRRATS